MAKNKMCDYKETDNRPPHGKNGLRYHGHPWIDDYTHEEQFRKIYKRVRVKCPKCGRRLIAWAAIHEGEVMHFAVPPHKKKRWWRR